MDYAALEAREQAEREWLHVGEVIADTIRNNTADAGQISVHAINAKCADAQPLTMGECLVGLMQCSGPALLRVALELRRLVEEASESDIAQCAADMEPGLRHLNVEMA